jgi:pyruvate/2-oxoacid:ferredoxin oxidoreductase beta subunit
MTRQQPRFQPSQGTRACPGCPRAVARRFGLRMTQGDGVIFVWVTHQFNTTTSMGCLTLNVLPATVQPLDVKRPMA